MRKVFTVTIVLIISIGLLLPFAIAEDKPSTETRPASPAPDTEPSTGANQSKEMTPVVPEKRKTSIYVGIVGKVDPKKKTIEVIKEKMDLGMLYEIKKETKFEGYKGLRNIKRGDRVKVEYDVIVGKAIALTVSREK